MPRAVACLAVQGVEVGHVVLVERLGPLRQDDVTVAGVGRADQAGPVPPDVLLVHGGPTVRVLLVGAALDPQAAARVAAWAPLGVVSLPDVRLGVVLPD